MNLIWRFIWTYIFSRFSSKVDLFSECAKTFFVLPTDIDVLMHMNNGRYFTIADVARLDFLLRAGAFQTFEKNKVYPVVASEMMRFKKSLRLFQRFQLTTQIMGWDEKFFYILHHYKNNNEVYALGLVKACFIQKGKGPISANQVVNLMGVDQASPPLPEWIMLWQNADQALFNESTHT